MLYFTTMKYLTILHYLAALTVNTQCQTHDQEKQLYTDLFSNYTKDIIPRRDLTKPLQLDLTFFLSALNGFKEVDEMISILGAPLMNWTDHSLKWDPAQYGNIISISINTRNIWLPSLFLINRVDKMEPIGHNIDFKATVMFTGQVFYNPGDILNAKCPSDISKFPYDTQQCELQILSWSISSTKLLINSVNKTARLDWYTPNADWSLQEYSTYTTEWAGYSIFYLKIGIKRQPLYYTVIIILPTILFAVLNPLVFILPVESGERVSLAMTILLSYAIFLTMVSASIPTSSNPMCNLLIVMIVIISVSGIITYGAIISAKYYTMDNINDVWSPLKTFTIWKIRKRRLNAISSKETSNKKFTGKDVSSIIDFLFFYGSYIVILSISVSYLISVAV